MKRKIISLISALITIILLVGPKASFCYAETNDEVSDSILPVGSIYLVEESYPGDTYAIKTINVGQIIR